MFLNSFLILVLLFILSHPTKSENEDIFCKTEHKCVTSTCNNLESVNDLDDEILLVDVNDQDDKGNMEWSKAGENRIFFIESSGRDYLTQRQACTLESAARNSGIKNLVVVMTSKVLRASANNATRQLLQQYAKPNVFADRSRIFFRFVDVNDILKGTPFEKTHIEGRMKIKKNRSHSVANYSDVIRLVLLKKYGGWYSDLDMVFLKSLIDLQNVIGSDSVPTWIAKNPEIYGKHLSNAIFHVDANHSLVEAAIQKHSEVFNGEWASGGPKLITKAFTTICDTPKDSTSKGYFNSIDNSRENCKGMTVVSPSTFYPVAWFDVSTLWTPWKTHSDWMEMFKNSRTVHFYQTSSKNNDPVLRPEYYPNEKFPAYLPLALENCPFSFFSDEYF